MTISADESPARTPLGRGATLKGAVAEAAKLLDDLVAADMAELGLTLGEADVLTVVHVAGHDPMPSEIADWLSLTGAGTTGRLNGLERRGLLQRRPNPDDKRSVTVHLTERGLALAASVVDAKDAQVMHTLVDRVGAQVADQLIEGLQAVIVAARDALEHRLED